MLKNMSSKEVSWWVAFEQHTGPLGQRYSEGMLASILEAVNALNHTMGAVFAALSEGGKNPVPAPKPVKRPHELFDAVAAVRAEDEEGDDGKGLTPEQRAVVNDPEYMPPEEFAKLLMLRNEAYGK